MMSARQLNQAHELTTQITATTRLLAAYSETMDVIVAQVSDRPHGYITGDHRVILQHGEIGAAIDAALKTRIRAMKAQLLELGVEWTDDAAA